MYSVGRVRVSPDETSYSAAIYTEANQNFRSVGHTAEERPRRPFNTRSISARK